MALNSRLPENVAKIGQDDATMLDVIEQLKAMVDEPTKPKGKRG